jgi:hypothetical protein
VQFNTSHLANESWDDPLPLRVDGKDGFGGWYRGLTPSEISNSDQMQPYWEDDERKRTLYQQNIDDADYIVLSSSRAAWSVTRLPVRYPLMVAYYRALMDGSLGFDLVGSFHSAPNIGPLRINDVTAEVNSATLAGAAAGDRPAYFSAEEAFNVSDHPPVWIFKEP